MSYDFAVIPTDLFDTAEEALKISDAFYDAPETAPPPPAADLVAELDRRDETGGQGFLSMWPVETHARPLLPKHRARAFRGGPDALGLDDQRARRAIYAAPKLAPLRPLDRRAGIRPSGRTTHDSGALGRRHWLHGARD